MCSRLILKAVSYGILVLCVPVITFLIVGVIFLAVYPHCDALYFGTEQPHTLILPNLYNLSLSDGKSLLAGNYKLSSEYRLQVSRDAALMFKLCIRKRYFTTVSACVDVGTDPENLWICSPDMRPDCLPSAIVDHFFGLSLWYQEESTVMYTIVDIESSMISGKNVTNTTSTLSAVWYDGLGCQVFVKLTIAVIFFGSLIFICCLGCAGRCLWICRYYCKQKCCSHTLSQRQLRGQEHDDEIALTKFKESEISEEETDNEAVPLVSRLSDANQSDSSGEEQELQVRLLPAGGVSSKESIRTAVSERGHRRRGHRSRYVHSKHPMVGYFTDSSSMSGVATDVSTNDASDEGSSDEGDVTAGSHMDSQLSSSSSSVTPRVQEATGVGTPPPFAHFHPTTVYDHRPGVSTEPRQPPDGI